MRIIILLFSLTFLSGCSYLITKEELEIKKDEMLIDKNFKQKELDFRKDEMIMNRNLKEKEMQNNIYFKNIETQNSLEIKKLELEIEKIKLQQEKYDSEIFFK